MARILLVDDKDILNINSIFLEREGYECLLAETAAQAYALIEIENPDLIVLDILLPDSTGIEICKKIRHYTIAPVIFLTSLLEDAKKIEALQIGGDETKDNAAIYHYNDGEKMWEFIGGTLADGRISVSVNHFSTYGVLSEKAGVDIIKPVVKKDEENTSLPKSATNIYNLLMIGFLFIMVGIISWYVRKRLKVVK